MRILWFTNSSSCYAANLRRNIVGGYNGGGWISSAEKGIRQVKDVELGVGFILNGQPFKAEQNGVTYYPIPAPDQSIVKKVLNKVDGIFGDLYKKEEESWPYYLGYFRKIIEDFQPDLIHVWGSEMHFGLVHQVTDKPIVLHIQGIINPYLNAYLPPFVSWKEYRRIAPSMKRSVQLLTEKQGWMRQAYRERIICKGIHHFLGRTAWDERATHILNPTAHYYHVDEILRDDFYVDTARNVPERLTIITTISQPLYKGFDLVLKTAKFLKENLALDFEWKCYGNIDPSLVERLIGIRHEDVNVKLMGVATSQELMEAELNATLYFHSSYIDNSPNSLCEAQMLGLPIVSTNVGGIPSLVEEGKNGYLVPANDPYQAAYLIEKLFRDKELNVDMGLEAQRVARIRHEKSRVIGQILSVYDSLLKGK